MFGYGHLYRGMACFARGELFGAHSAALLSPLAQPLPINATEHLRKGDEFNRHTVLHGESLDYGTRINGFKEISLINYVVRIFFNVEEDKASMAKAASSSARR